MTLETAIQDHVEKQEVEIAAAMQASPAALCTAIERRLAAEPGSSDAEVFAEMLGSNLSHVSADTLARELVRRLTLPQERVIATKRKQWPAERTAAEKACEERMWPVAQPDAGRVAEWVKDAGMEPDKVFPGRGLVEAGNVPDVELEHLLRLAARVAYDFDFDAVDEMRHTLARTGVFGRYTHQAIAGDLLLCDKGVRAHGDT